MRNWILGGFLACITSAGVAYVLAKNDTGSHCGPCVEKPSQTETVKLQPLDQGSWSDKGECEHCSKCKEGPTTVVDVVDLDRSFRMADGTPKPVVSFEEPPLAKPRGEVMPVKFEVPAVEVLPMPREVEAESNFFKPVREFLKRATTISKTDVLTLPSQHYLKHYPTYFAPEPDFPLQRERDSMLDSNGEIRREPMPSGSK